MARPYDQEAAPMGMQRALALFPSQRGPRWLSFRDPLAVHRADHLDEVGAVVAAAERAAADGRWVVLVVAYDAAPAFEPAMAAHRHHRAPLAVAAAFDRPESVVGPRPASHRVGPWRTSWDEAAHAAAVERVRDHIAAGDVYQVNLTHRLRAEFEGDPEGLFTALFRAQAPAHAAYVELDGGAICSASPELLVGRVGCRLTTRPMKGTAARADDGDADRAVVAALRASPKDRAENAMIVDVARNDLGRVARVGSIEADRLWAVEHYPTVHQLTSRVRADSDAALGPVLAAMFPAASITGAPKVRATQVIRDLEVDARGVYCGTVGVLGPPGWQLNVAIRTAWVDTVEGRVEYGVGGGIVWDSVAAAEWAEAGAKAAILGGPVPYRLLETMRWEPATGIRAVDRHRARLLDTARYLGFDVAPSQVDAALAPFGTAPAASARAQGPGPATVATAPAAPPGAGPVPPGARAGDGSARVRLLVDAEGGCEVDVGDAPRRGTRERPAGPWRAALAAEPVRADDVFCRHKTTHRTVYDLARRSRPDVDEVICWNDDGLLTETTVGNLVLELDGRLLTPHLGAGLLAGTTRAELLEAGTVVEDAVPVSALARASGVWAVNAVRGWVRLEVVGAGLGSGSGG